MTTEDNNEVVEEAAVKKPRKKKSPYDAIQKDGRDAYMSVYTISILTDRWTEYKVVAEEERIAMRLMGWNGADPMTIEASDYFP